MLLSLLLSVSALACPDLSGTFTACATAKGPMDVDRIEISQSGIQLKYTSYDKKGKMSQGSYVADGAVRVVDNLTLSTASCTQEAYVIVTDREVPQLGRRIKVQQRYYRAGENLRVDISLENNAAVTASCRRL